MNSILLNLRHSTEEKLPWLPGTTPRVSSMWKSLSPQCNLAKPWAGETNQNNLSPQLSGTDCIYNWLGFFSRFTAKVQVGPASISPTKVITCSAMSLIFGIPNELRQKSWVCWAPAWRMGQREAQWVCLQCWRTKNSSSLQKFCMSVKLRQPTASFKKEYLWPEGHTKQKNLFPLSGCGSEALPTSSAASWEIAGGKRISQSRDLQQETKHTVPSAKVKSKNVSQQGLKAVSIQAERHVEKAPE